MNTQTPESESHSGIIDTSRMSAGQRAALETAEAAREESTGLGFAASLFLGRPEFGRIFPFPQQSDEDRDQGDAFLGRLDGVLAGADPDAIDRDGEIPDDVLAALAEIGAFGIKIPAKYGGLGLSQTNYSRAAMRLGGFCGNLTALLSAHQSIGVPQPLLMFGTEDQRTAFLPRCAGGEISAFALTEPEVGSDPARMRTTAEPTADSTHFVINGEKLWCTNGTRAGLLVVMARTPAPDGDPAKSGARAPITAFVVEASTPGIEVVRRCRFMGLRALYNAVIRFRDVRVPRENILLGEGRGLRVALSTLNVGRITLPAACAGASNRCQEIATRWAATREQWGSRIGDHGAIAGKLARIKAHSWAIESMVLHVSALADRKEDVRLEAALAKLWGTEKAWEIVNDTMQIRGGRGYETADSLRARGESPDPVERFLRDCRINTIFEGSTEIMHLFIAREILDPHLKAGAPLLDSRRPLTDRIRAAGPAVRFYLPHLAGVVVPGRTAAADGPYRNQARAIARLSRRLARTIIKALARYGPKFEREQLLLARLVEAGAELMAASVSIARAAADPAADPAVVRHLCRLCESRARHHLRNPFRPEDRESRRIARNMMDAPREPAYPARTTA